MNLNQLIITSADQILKLIKKIEKIRLNKLLDKLKVSKISFCSLIIKMEVKFHF
jgi:hypothetical protein